MHEHGHEHRRAVRQAALAAGWSHRHRDVSGGWLRPTVFGAVDGLVTNASLIAGLGGGGVSAHTVVLTGVAALVAGALAQVASLAEMQGTALVTEVAAGLPLFTGDANKLSRTIVNLVANAIKFTGAGTVTISVSQQPESLQPPCARVPAARPAPARCCARC